MSKILRKPAVRQKTGLSDSTIWRLEKADEFPRRIQLSPNAVGWWEHEIDQWLAQRQRQGSRAARPTQRTQEGAGA